MKDIRLEDMTLQHLRAYAKSLGIKTMPTMGRQKLLEALADHESPVEIYRNKDHELIFATEADIKPVEIEKAPIYVKNRVAIQGIGVFERGYHIVNKSDLPKIAGAKNVRAVTHEELKSYYGVK